MGTMRLGGSLLPSKASRCSPMAPRFTWGPLTERPSCPGPAAESQLDRLSQGVALRVDTHATPPAAILKSTYLANPMKSSWFVLM